MRNILFIFFRNFFFRDIVVVYCIFVVCFVKCYLFNLIWKGWWRVFCGWLWFFWVYIVYYVGIGEMVSVVFKFSEWLLSCLDLKEENMDCFWFLRFCLIWRNEIKRVGGIFLVSWCFWKVKSGFWIIFYYVLYCSLYVVYYW